MWSTRVLGGTQEVLSLGAGAVFHHFPMARSGFLGLVDYRSTRFTQGWRTEMDETKKMDEQWRIYLKVVWLFIFYMLCKLAEDDLVCLESAHKSWPLSDPTQCKCFRIRKSSPNFTKKLQLGVDLSGCESMITCIYAPPRMQSSTPGCMKHF